MLSFAINNPIKVLVGVLFILLFGFQAVTSMPYQLSPSVEYPTVTVRTSWPGATPYEVEREIIEKQENVLKSLPGLMEMESTSGTGNGFIVLQFELGSDQMNNMLQVTNKLNEVRSYPENVERPVVRASSGSDSSPIVFMLFSLEDNAGDIDSFLSYIDDNVMPRFERIAGVADTFFFGGRAVQMHITVNPEKMSAYGVSVDQLSSLIAQENVNISGGTLSVGRKDYRMRTVAEFNRPEDILQMLVRSENGGFVKVADFAEVDYGYAKSNSAVKSQGERVMMLGIIKETNANVLEVTDAVEAVFHELNTHELANKGISLKWIYDQRPYIRGAINLVKGNIVIGGILAITVLLIFLRSFSSTMVVATAIPISIIGTFVILWLMGKSLNVISLAGIAFAVGILIDNAIVVLENIDRHRRLGKVPFKAALDGAGEVWGAVLASTLTTVAVFLPIAFVKEEAGQLFKDIALAVSGAVLISLIVSMCVIPPLAKILYERMPSQKNLSLSDKIGSYGNTLATLIMRFSGWINSSVTRKFATTLVLTTLALGSTAMLYPKMEYLPLGNMNMVESSFQLPAGLSLAEREALGDYFYEQVKPHIGIEIDGAPAIENFFYMVNNSGMSARATAQDPERASELVPLLASLIRNVPGGSGSTSQSGIFENRGSGGRNVSVAVSGEHIDTLVEATLIITRKLNELIPGIQIRPRPSTDLLYPEATFTPRAERLKEAGMTPAELGRTLNVFIDGRKVGEFYDKDLGNIDLLIRTERTAVANPYEAALIPLSLKNGEIVPLGSVADLELTFGMDAIRRYERERTFSLGVTTPDGMVLEELTDLIQNEVIIPLQKAGELDGINIRYAGSASKLADAKNAFKANFIMAIIISFLLMVALFDNFLYPFIIMFTMPLAMAGGFVGLYLVNIFIAPQSFDVLTMLGFVLLIGVVVNNAILIVHQTLNNVRRYKMTKDEAISTALASRLRPIAMSAMTSLFGMLPLVLAPGPGSELYRGIGSVVLGGLTLSTVFTVFMIPALLSLLMKDKKGEQTA